MAEADEMEKAMLEPVEVEVKVKVPGFILKVCPEGKDRKKALETWLNAILREEGKNILNLVRNTPRETLEALEKINSLQKKERKPN